MTTIHGGKGDKQRPTDKKKFDDNYDRIFRKPKPDKVKPNENGSHPEQRGRED